MIYMWNYVSVNQASKFEIICQYNASIMSSFVYKKIVYDFNLREKRDNSFIHSFIKLNKKNLW